MKLLKRHTCEIFMIVTMNILFSAQLFPQAQGGSYLLQNNVGNILIQPDGKIVLQSRLSGSVVRYNPELSLDESFISVRENQNDIGYALVLQPDGKILVGKGGSQYPEYRKWLRRLNPDGSVDSSFADPLADTAGFGGNVKSIVLLPNGQIYIGGDFRTNGQTHRSLARINSDGTLDSSFANTVLFNDFEIETMISQPDNKLIVGGTFDNVGGIPRPGIVRFNTDGTLDQTFSPPSLDGPGNVFTIVKQTDGKLFIGGDFTVTEGKRIHRNFVRINADGTLDPTFFLGPNDTQTHPVIAAGIQPDGKVIIGEGDGWFIEYGVDFNTRIAARFNPSGSRDISFKNIPSNINISNPSYSSRVTHIKFQADGKIILAGYIKGHRLNAVFSVVRLDTDGRWDMPFARFDFDGDKRADLAVFRPSNSTWYINTGQAYWSRNFGESTDRLTPADFDGDGKTDIAVYRPSNRMWYWIDSATNTFSYLPWGEPGDVPVPGHILYPHRLPIYYNPPPINDRKQFYVYRPSTGMWYRLYRSQYSSEQLGMPGDIPLSGHWGADFISRPAVYRPSDGTFYLRESPGVATPGAVTSYPLGAFGDVPVVGDFDGDFQSDLAVYRPSNGAWIIRQSGSGTIITRYFGGETGDIPVPADYDGDQVDDIAIFRPSTGTWWIIGSTEGMRAQNFGQAGDIPVQSSYLQLN